MIKIILCSLLVLMTAPAQAERVKDLASVAGVRSNQLIGYGLVVGLNGSGKTNLLDAIYYLALTKSAFNATDINTIREGESATFIRGSFFNGEKSHELTCGIQKGFKKSFRVEGQEYAKLSDDEKKQVLKNRFILR